MDQSNNENWVVRLRNRGISKWIIDELYNRYGQLVNTEKFQWMIGELEKDDQRYGFWKFVFGRDKISSDHDIATKLIYLGFPVATVAEIQARFSADYGTDAAASGVVGIVKLATAPIVIFAATVGGTAIIAYKTIFGGE